MTLSLVGGAPVSGGEVSDPFLWLEEVDGERALEWVKERNVHSVGELEKVPQFEAIHARNLEIATSAERIPAVALRGDRLYNFWQDAEHPRGLWRRTGLDEYRKAQPAWESVLDVDALAASEGEGWVWKGAGCLPPEYRLCLVSLSRGGGDATVVREFDAASKAFVEDGFALSEAKNWVSWRDADTLWVGTDFGEGSLTNSGYPRVTKLWKRGTPLDTATTVFEGQQGDVGVSGWSLFTPEARYDFVTRTPAFYRGEHHLVQGEQLVKLEVPEDVNLQGIFKGQLVLSLRSDWRIGPDNHPAGALLAIDLDAFLSGERVFETLSTPGERTSLDSVAATRDRLLVSTLDNVRGRLWQYQLGDGEWSRQELGLPGMGTVGIAASAQDQPLFFFSYEDFLTPTQLHLVAPEQAPEPIKSTPEWFDASGMSVEQHEATSADGTRVPYFVALPRKSAPAGSRPTLLYGYGGFEVSELPSYSGMIGSSWLARGGVYVVANIRGGGELGPHWHQAALKEHRQRSFDDFIAVAEDLVTQGITTPAQLGIMGGSNGGLLVGAAFTQRPELFGAVVCAVPLLDMQRYHRLLAGASWMAEYGNPDVPEEWAFIKTWSPYHNLSKEAEYPEVFFFTSTRDDRVHPAHARKMVARMQEMGHEVLYWENIEGGHAAATTPQQRAHMWSLAYAYLWRQLQ